MSIKKKINKKKINFENLTSFIPKNIKLKKLNADPSNFIDNTKNKISKYFRKVKEDREKEQIKLKKLRKLEEKKELQRQKKTRSKR